MRGLIAVIAIFFLISMGLGLRIFLKSNATVLPVLGSVPSFQFTDTSEQDFGLENLRGQVWVVDFIFTTCPGPCPAMAQQMSRIHHQFRSVSRVHQVSISVNPAYDTPAILADYAKRFDADTRQWHFLHAPEEEVLKLTVEGFKMGNPDDVIAHSQRFALVDGQGQIRGYYLGTDATSVDQLILDLNSLI